MSPLRRFAPPVDACSLRSLQGLIQYSLTFARSKDRRFSWAKALRNYASQKTLAKYLNSILSYLPLRILPYRALLRKRSWLGLAGLKNSRPLTVKSFFLEFNFKFDLILFKYFIYIFNILQDIKYKDLL